MSHRRTRHSSSSAFGEGIQDAAELAEAGRGRFKALDEVKLRLDLAANASRQLLAQWPCYNSEREAAQGRQRGSGGPSGKMYLFSDALLYATASPLSSSSHAYEMQALLPLYRLSAAIAELPSRTWRLQLSCGAAGRPLVVFVADEQAAKTLPAAAALERNAPVVDDGQQEIVRVAIADSEALLPLGLSRAHKAIAVSCVTTADDMRDDMLQKMCANLTPDHARTVAAECHDYRIWRVAPHRHDEAVFDGDDCPLRYLSVDPDWSLVMKPWPPRTVNSQLVSSQAATPPATTSQAQSAGDLTSGDEELAGLIRVYFCDTPLLHRFEFNATTFKTLFISSRLTTGEVCKILVGKITDSTIVASSERKSVRGQLELYRLWGVSGDNRRIALDAASHPWPVFKKACAVDAHFRFVFAPSLQPATAGDESLSAAGAVSSSPLSSLSSSSAPSMHVSVLGLAPAGSKRHRPWMQKMLLGSSPSGSRKAAPSTLSVTPRLQRAAESTDWSADDTAASLHVEHELSSGGDRVLLARHAVSGKTLVVRELRGGGAARLRAVEADVAATLQHCRHPDLASVYGCCRPAVGAAELWLVVEHCAHGSLRQLLKSQPGGCLSEHEAVAVLLPVLRALDYLHTHGVVHRDLHCGNILITSAGEPKLAGYGIAGALPSPPTITITTTSPPSSPLLSSPLSVTSTTPPSATTSPARDSDIDDNNHIDSAHHYDSNENDDSSPTRSPFVAPEAGRTASITADIWSLGATVIEMLDGDVTAPPQLRAAPARSAEAGSFVSACLQLEPAKRPTAAELLSHPLLDSRSAIMELVSAAASCRSATARRSWQNNADDAKRNWQNSTDSDDAKRNWQNNTDDAKRHWQNNTDDAKRNWQNNTDDAKRNWQNSTDSDDSRAGESMLATHRAHVEPTGISLQDMENAIDAVISHRPAMGSPRSAVIDDKTNDDDDDDDDIQVCGSQELVLPGSLLELEEIAADSVSLPVEQELCAADDNGGRVEHTDVSVVDGYQPIEVVSVGGYFEEEIEV